MPAPGGIGGIASGAGKPAKIQFDPQTYNQHAVAGGINNAIASGLDPNGRRIVQALRGLSPAAARAALDNLSGEGITGTQEMAHRSSELFTSAMFDQTTLYGDGIGAAPNSVTLTAPLPYHGMLTDPQGRPVGDPGYGTPTDAQGRPISDPGYGPLTDAQGHPVGDPAYRPYQALAPVARERTWRAWATGYGGSEDVQGNGPVGSAAMNGTIYGGAVGVDYRFTPNYVGGIALGGSDGSFSVPGRATYGSTTGGNIGLYNIATFGRFYGAASTSFGYYTNKTTRSVAGVGALAGDTERGTFDSHEFRSRIEFGRHFDAYRSTITPFVALEIASLRTNGFTESTLSGPGLYALNVSGQTLNSVPAFVGARFQSATRVGNGMILSPILQVAYVHDFSPQRSLIGTIADLPGSTFLVYGAQPARNAAEVKVGGELALSARSVIYANFEGEFSGVSQFYAGKGGFRYIW